MHSYVPYSSNTTVNENRWKSSHNKSYTGTASHGNTKSPSYANSTSRFGNDTNKQNLKPGSTRFGNNVTKQNLRPSSTRFGSDITKQNIRPSSYGTSKQNLRPTSSRMGGNDTLKQSLRPMALRRGSNSGRMFDYEKAEVKILNTFEDDNLAASMYGGSTKSSKKKQDQVPKEDEENYQRLRLGCVDRTVDFRFYQMGCPRYQRHLSKCYYILDKFVGTNGTDCNFYMKTVVYKKRCTHRGVLVGSYCYLKHPNREIQRITESKRKIESSA